MKKIKILKSIFASKIPQKLRKLPKLKLYDLRTSSSTNLSSKQEL